MVNNIYTHFAVNHINRIYELGNLFLIRLSKCCEDDERPAFEFALNGVDHCDNTMDIYCYTDGTWKMVASSGIGFDYALLSSGIIPFIHFLNGHGHEVDFNEIRKTCGIEEEE